MATANKDTLVHMKSQLLKMGLVSHAVIGEPKKGAIAEGMVAIIPGSGEIDQSVLSRPHEVHRITLRRYANALREPYENVEFDMDAWRAEILEDLFGDFDLGGTVAYLLPNETDWVYGYDQLERTWYRMLDINIGYRIDPTATTYVK